jgi:AcrR family transcriptional regulator
MPRLWTEAVDTHRRAVRDAILDASAGLVADHGLRGVSMARIAEETGISRATLYKYFPDLEAILRAWHERQIHTHLRQLSTAREKVREPAERLAAVLESYALITHEARHGGDRHLAALLHGSEEVARAERLLIEMLRQMISEAAASGAVRDDLAPTELASYCVHALAAARSAESQEAVRRLVQVTLAGLRPPA